VKPDTSPRIEIQPQHEFLLLLSLSVVLMTTVYLVRVPPLRIVLGALHVLLLPGYSMTTALFPHREDLNVAERVGLSLGLSIAILPLLGLVLNYTPWGITLLSTLLCATAFVVGCAAVAYYRRGMLPPERQYLLRVQLDVEGWRSGGLLDRSLTVALAMCIVVALGTALFVLARPEGGESFTEFYVLGPWGDARIYPQNVLVGRPITVIVGVINREHQTVEYHVVTEVSGQEVEHLTGIRLEHDEKWEKTLTLTLQEPGEDQRVTFLLFREEQQEPYRSLHLWMDARVGATPQPRDVPRSLELRTPAPSPTAEHSPVTIPTAADTATPSVTAVTTPSPIASPARTDTPTATVPLQAIHVVQPGETVSSIGRFYGVSYQAIVEVNHLQDPNRIEVGQELLIPRPGE
jgi:uncharacterized membrane protein/LysM repeat protein